ncbi:MAG: GAF domain-containing protein [Hyphomicrobiales bacterium]|nr:GAF domain-containing protein [Hyphomicrobiales bacterium]
MTDSPTNVEIDLTNCDREPIHIPGTIQPHGILFACGVDDWRISHASQNVAQFFDKSADELIGAQLDHLLGASAILELANSGASNESTFAPLRRFAIEAGGRKQKFDVTLHVQNGRKIIELEAMDDAVAVESLDLVRAMVARIKTAKTVAQLWSHTVRQLRLLIGYDRVMIYRFQHDGAGEVVAEARRADLEPFLDLRYPASDIPKQARELYKKSLIRVIGDVDAACVPVLPQRDVNGQALDLSFSSLRAVSPIHIEYLKNMGVSASMSISIIVGGELWGLIVCHHRSAKVVPADVRVAAELFGQFFSVQLEGMEREQAYDVTRGARLRLDGLVAAFPSDGSLAENLAARLDDLKTILPCDGVGLWIDGIWQGLGRTPPAVTIAALARFLDSNSERPMFITHELSRRFPPAASYAAEASGLLAVPLAATGRQYLMYFRTEVQHSVSWAGDPSKPVTVGEHGDRLTPRQSFAVWKQSVHNQALPWILTERLTAEALRMSLLEVVLRLREVVEEERRRNSERQNLLLAELNHRVKNILALISALVKRGSEPDEPLASYIRGLEGRIRSLATAHDLISKSTMSDLRSLLDTEISAYRTKVEQITLRGPSVALSAYAFPVMALLVHEMMTNAVKYGALSVSSGRLVIAWEIDDRNQLVFTWEESGGPAVQMPKQEGFGSVLIKKNIPFELGGEATVRYELSGLQARFVIPAKFVGPNISAENNVPAAPIKQLSSVGSIEGLSILLVEDQMLIALDTQAMLEDAGAGHVEAVPNAADALRLIAVTPPDAAVLDVNLGAGTSFPIADELAARGVPFVFATGYSDQINFPPRYRDMVVVQKPFMADSLVAALTAALTKHRKPS